MADSRACHGKASFIASLIDRSSYYLLMQILGMVLHVIFALSSLLETSSGF